MRINEPLLPQNPAALSGAASAQAPHKNRFSTSRMAGSTPVWHPKAAPAAFAPQTTPANTSSAEKTGTTPSGVPTNEQLGFGDFLDVINPLQHIPVVSTLYRKMTGDKISAPAQFMGGLLYGGPVGAAGAMVSVAVQDKTGKDFGENVAALVDGSGNAFSAKEPDLKLATNADGSVNFDSITPGGHKSYDYGVMPRTAGLMPVWTDKTVALASADNIPALPTGRLSPETNFNMTLQGLEADTPKIS